MVTQHGGFMADPISSLNPSNSANACVDDDGGANAAPVVSQAPVTTTDPLMCSPDSGVCTAQPSAVRALVGKFSSTSLPTAAVPSAPLAVSTGVLTASSGSTPGGSSRLATTLVTQDITLGPLESKLELGGVSRQTGPDFDDQIALARRTTALSGGGYSLSAVGDVVALRANLGEHNDDGSIGGNIGLGGEILGGEATVNTPYGSLTGGVGISASLGGSMGVRDADHDGKPEFCAKFSIPELTVGACVEQFW
jgi:hypothetical protein